MQFYSFDHDGLNHHGIWATIPCSPKMVTVPVRSKLKANWKSVVFTNNVGKNSRYSETSIKRTPFIKLTLGKVPKVSS